MPNKLFLCRNQENVINMSRYSYYFFLLRDNLLRLLDKLTSLYAKIFYYFKKFINSKSNIWQSMPRLCEIFNSVNCSLISLSPSGWYLLRFLSISSFTVSGYCLIQTYHKRSRIISPSLLNTSFCFRYETLGKNIKFKIKWLIPTFGKGLPPFPCGLLLRHDVVFSVVLSRNTDWRNMLWDALLNLRRGLITTLTSPALNRVLVGRLYTPSV